MKFITPLACLTCLTAGTLAAQDDRDFPDPMPTRQVHLDFHTSEQIEGIGEKFDKAQFQAALQAGRLNQINVFAKGHHSMSYYPTKAGRQHPHLDFDLLGAEIEACHEIGVKAPIYFTVGWSSNDAENHPEWVNRRPDGSFMAFAEGGYDLYADPSDELPTYAWKFLVPLGTYHDTIIAQVEEICTAYDVDGFWFDIYHMNEEGCYNDLCIERMRAEGIDPYDHPANVAWFTEAIKGHMQDLRDLIARYHPEATVYFNPASRLNLEATIAHQMYAKNTHQDLEDLPTTWEGYDKAPLQAKYHSGRGYSITAMSGKFHKAWGEFGGFKHPDAIKYEAASMIAYGASCNFGDQLHPSGEMDMETYRRIGEAYAYVEQIEEYGPGGLPFARLGLWFDRNYEHAKAVNDLLLEMHRDFEIADTNNYEKFELIVIPGKSVLSAATGARLDAYVAGGGKIVVIGEGALVADDSTATAIDIGAEVIGPSPYDFDYTVVTSEALMTDDMIESPFLNYDAALRVRPTGGEVLARVHEPFFNRTYGSYSSHRETPYKLEPADYPAAVRNGNVIFLAHPLDELYEGHGVRLHRDLLESAIDILYPDPILEVDGMPSTGRVSLLQQGDDDRYVVHLLYGPPIQRGEVQVLEDFPPVPNATVRLRVPEAVKSAYLIPGEQKVDFAEVEDGVVEVSVPEFTMHTGVVFEY